MSNWFTNLFRKRKPVQASSFQDRFRRINRIAILYPLEIEYARIARYTLQRLYQSEEPFQFLMVHSSERAEMVAGLPYAVLAFDPLLKKEHRAELSEGLAAFRADLLLQLEPDPPEVLSALIAQADIPLKMGFGEEQEGLNLTFANKENAFYEKSILNLIQLLMKK